MGTSDTTNKATVRIIASDKTWIEGNSIQQLETTAKLRGITLAVGMPDLHAGKGYPIGAAFLSGCWLYPALVGNDIGCGMGFWKTDLKSAKLKLDKWYAKLFLDDVWEGDRHAWLESYNLPATLCDLSVGTIGGGNHFAELQRVEKILDKDGCNQLGLSTDYLYLLVHSGSRGLGHAILTRHVETFGHAGLTAHSPDGAKYITEHDQAVRWAKANRALIAHRFLSGIRSDGIKMLDIAHNTLTEITTEDMRGWVHRKGVSPSDQGPLVIPGSRGSFTYLVKPIGPQSENAYSLAHGAGRKWMRSEVKARLSHKYKPTDFYKTPLGGVVICEDKALIYEEAPEAYKNIDQVIQDMVDAGLISIMAILRPALTYKTRRKK